VIVLVSGSGGLLGSALGPSLAERGDTVRRLVRRPASAPGEVTWDPATWRVDPAGLEGTDAVVHLAGENVASGRWTDARKARIRDSRADGTRGLAESLAALERKPRVLVSASAVGFYGLSADARFDETSPHGAGFLADVCRAWEAATEPARNVGIRVVHLRFGVILTPVGGALKRMLPPFRLGLGGRLGSGAQWMSWITLDDAVRAVLHALDTETLAGPVNAVAPNAVTNAAFTRALGRALGRPTVFPMPAFAARLAFGAMADEMLLAGQRAVPRALEESGFAFEHDELEAALRAMLA
jgi:uncharacterized protein (TIGR01777 family)